jgi:hypothetical protein
VPLIHVKLTHVQQRTHAPLTHVKPHILAQHMHIKKIQRQ